MKKILFVLLIFFAIPTVHAQEKGLYVTLNGGLGWTSFDYSIDNGENIGRLGYGGSVGLQYFFTRHWGVSVAGELFTFNTQTYYKNKSFLFKDQIDDQGHVNDLTVRLKEWKENQTTLFMEIPVMLMYQKKFGKKEKYGWYFGVGVKAQIPINSSYERGDGSINVSAHYNEWELPLGEEGLSAELPQHGYGTNGKRLWGGSNDLKTGFAAVGEVGALIGLSPRVDLTLGVSVDHGFVNINKENVEFIGPKTGLNQQSGTYIAENVFYNGALNSTEMDRINPTSVRGKIGIRIKIGKLEERPVIEEDAAVVIPTRDTVFIVSTRDTIIVNPVIIEVPVPTPVPATVEDKIQQPLSQEIVDTLIESVYFDLNRYDLNAGAKKVLNRKVELMKKYPKAALSIIGHTCDLGGGELNDKLSFNRAEAARYYLIEKGINASRITTIPKGKRDPSYPNISDKNRELNRRIDFIIAE